MSEIDYAALEAMRQAANRTWNQDELWRDYEAAQNAYSTALFDAAPALIAKAEEADDEWRAQFERANIYKTLANNLSGELDAARALLAKAEEALEPFAEYAEFVSRNHPGWDHDEFATSLPDAWANDLAVQRFAVYRAAGSIRDEIKEALK